MKYSNLMAILISGLLGTVIMFTDRLILGRYSPDTLASMQVIGPITWTAFSIFGSFGIGMLAILGQLGRGYQQSK